MNLSVNEIKAALESLPDYTDYKNDYYVVVLPIINVKGTYSLLPDIKEKRIKFVKNPKLRQWELDNVYPDSGPAELITRADCIIKDLVENVRFHAHRSNGLNKAYYAAAKYLDDINMVAENG